MSYTYGPGVNEPPAISRLGAGDRLPLVIQKAPGQTQPLLIAYDTDGKTILLQVDEKGRIVPTGTPVIQSNELLTTTIASNQVILTYTVPAGVNFYMVYFHASATLLTPSVTGSVLGYVSLQTTFGSQPIADLLCNPTTEQIDRIAYDFSVPMVFPAGTTINVYADPQTTNSIEWIANLGGYTQ